MKIGISSYSFEKYRKETGADLFEVCRLAREIGFDAIEFIDLGTPDPIATAKELRAYCKEIGLTIASHTIGADLVNGDEEEILSKLTAGTATDSDIWTLLSAMFRDNEYYESRV